jgi:hypothetical protein
MKPILHCCCAALLLAFTLPVQAQISPVKIVVNKRQQTKNVAAGQYNNIHNQTFRTLVFDVDASNLSAKPIENLVVRWSILVQPAHTSGISSAQLAEGTKKLSLKVAERLKVESDAVELSKCTGCGSESQLIAYVVEAQVDGKTVATDTGSTSAKDKIEQYRSAKERANRPRRDF